MNQPQILNYDDDNYHFDWWNNKNKTIKMATTIWDWRCTYNTQMAQRIHFSSTCTAKYNNFNLTTEYRSNKKYLANSNTQPKQQQ